MEEMGVGLEIARGNVVAHDLRSGEAAGGREDVGGKRRVELAAGMLSDHWRLGLDLPGEAVMHGRKDGGDGEIGVRVGSRNPVLDTPTGAPVGRDAEGNGAIVLAPPSVHGSEEAAEAPERVAIGREDRERIGQKYLQAGDSMAEPLLSGFGLA